MINHNIHIGDLLKDLDSPNLAIFGSALETGVDVIENIIKRTIQGLSRSDSQVVTGEKLTSILLLITNSLEEVLSSSVSLDEKIIAAAILLQAGIRTGIPYLLEGIESSKEWGGFAAIKLARAQIIEAGDKIISRLRNLSLDQSEELNSLFWCLKKLDITPPSDLEEKLNACPGIKK